MLARALTLLHPQEARLLQQALQQWSATTTPRATAAAAASGWLSAPGAACGGGSLACASAAVPSLLWRGVSSEAATTTPGWPGGAAAAPAAAGRSGSTHAGPPQQQQQQRQLSPQLFCDSFKSPVKPLNFARGEVVYLPQLENNIAGRALLHLLGAYSRKQQLRNGAAVLYQAVTEAAEDEDLQQAVGLTPGTFTANFYLASLHMWLIINRLNQEPDSKDVQAFRHALYHDFFHRDLERRVHAAGVQVGVNKWMRTLQDWFYTHSFAFDNALHTQGASGHERHEREAAFEAALLKAVYDNADDHKAWAALLARYLTRQLKCLDKTDLEAIFKGHVRFSFDVVRQ